MIKFSSLLNFVKRRQKAGPLIQGYIDEISSSHVAGWICDRSDPYVRVNFNVAIVSPEGTHVIARGQADQAYPGLDDLGSDARNYGFRVELPASLTAQERDNLVVFPDGAKHSLQRAGKFQGFVNERSIQHVAGWVRNRFDPAERVAFEVVVAYHGERVVGQGFADQRHNALVAESLGDAHYGFRLDFSEPLSEAERDSILVRPVGASAPLPLSPRLTSASLVLIQGYVDEISSTSVSGWIRDGFNPNARVNFDVAVVLPEGTRAVGRGRADQAYPGLNDGSFGDGKYGFKVQFPAPLTARERDNLVVRPLHTQKPLERAPKFQGFVNERSINHVAGWVRNRFDPAERVTFEVAVITQGEERVIERGTADSFYTALAQQSVEDAFHGFQLIFKTPITEAERDAVIVRPVGNQTPLQLSPRLLTSFELLSFVAMDIVNNCNLRCPFCLFDYADTRSTRFMPEETFDSALRLIPHVNDAGFWLSCLHEPSLHPDFLRLIDRIPRQWRRKVMFTTNLAKRMPDSYYEALADSGVFHINLSLESLTPAIYEKFRKGARWPIFKENWDKLINAWKAAPAPPRLRYIIMAYQSNRAEIPALVKYLREERLAWQVEVRYTYEMSHIPENFVESEYLHGPEWDWLAAQLAGYSNEEVLLIQPLKVLETESSATALSPLQSSTSHVTVTPEPADRITARPTIHPAAFEKKPELPLNIEVEWDGEITICGKWDHPSERKRLAAKNIKDVDEPYDYLVAISNEPVPEYLPDRDLGPLIQGYVDAISASNIAGWIRDAQDPDLRVNFEIAIGDMVIASGCADGFTPSLKATAIDDGKHGFNVTLAQPLTAQEREHLIVRDANTKIDLERAPKFQGFVNELSTRRIAGWVRNRFDPEQRVNIDIVLATAAGNEILWQGEANKFNSELIEDGFTGDARYGFCFEFPREFSEAERDAVMAWPVGAEMPLELSPYHGPLVQGYVDEISADKVIGWIRDARDPDLQVSFEVALVFDDETRVIAQGQAGEFCPSLAHLPDDTGHGFNVVFAAPLNADERNRLVVRTVDSKLTIDRAPNYQGYVDELSGHHIAGWVRNRFDPEQRVDVEIVLETPAGAERLCQGAADKFSAKLIRDSLGDGCYSFEFRFPRIISESERDSVVARPAGITVPLEFSPRLAKSRLTVN
jgi:MoaA/NifB/PqqE/SkfB family radical SAM enzyme